MITPAERGPADSAEIDTRIFPSVHSRVSLGWSVGTGIVIRVEGLIFGTLKAVRSDLEGISVVRSMDLGCIRWNFQMFRVWTCLEIEM